MKAIKSKNTTIEVLLAKSLWKAGLRYRKNNKKVYGCPDLTFRKYKIAIFLDGEFFHGYNWDEKKLKIKVNRDYWIPKIERNMQRDREVNGYLSEHGWIVIRFWGQEVKKNLEGCVGTIKAAIEEAKQQPIK